MLYGYKLINSFKITSINHFLGHLQPNVLKKNFIEPSFRADLSMGSSVKGSS